MSSLRQVPWPTLPSVDLATEFHWLIRPAQNEHEPLESGAHRQQHEASAACAGSSPYEQLLNRQRDARPPLSPQQQAAKTIMKLKQEMRLPSSMESLRNDLAVDDTADLRTLINHNTAADDRKSRDNNGLLRRRKTPVGSKAVVRSQSAHKKHDLEGKSTAKPPQKRRPESTQASANLRAKQKQLASWLSRDNKLNKPSKSPELFSLEVDWRIHAAMSDHTGEGLWRDQVASVIAAEMTSESVFGGFIPTRRLALHPSPPKAQAPKSEALIQPAEHVSKPIEPTSCDETLNSAEAASLMHADKLKPSLMAIVAHEIREEACEQAAQGAVEEALLTLEHGIRHILEDFQDNQDEIQVHGFNFSRDAHEKATRVQLKYRARHRDRVFKATTLQRVWRAVHSRKAELAQAKYEAHNAQAIQRQYKRHYNTRRREQSACRIQLCFRIYQEQKHFIHLLQACRFLVAQERRRIEKIKQFEAMKKRLWVKLRTALRVIWLWRMRRRGLTSLQKRWKGAKARKAYTLVLARETMNEMYRLEREEAFVNARLGRAMGFYEQFLRQTQRGRALVSWQTKRPFIRWKRRRKDWSSMDRAQQIPLLCALYAPTQRVKGAELRAIWQLLNVQDDTYQHAHELNLSPSALAYLLQPGTNCGQLAADSTSRWRILRWFHRMRASFVQQLHAMVSAIRRFGLLAYWNLVLMPRKYHFERRAKPSRQRALETLKFTQQQILTKFLRQLFRRLEDANRPKYACALCCMAFGTVKAYHAHLNRAGNCRTDFEIAQQEWEEVRRDATRIGSKQTLMVWEDSARFEPGQGRFPTSTSKYAFLLLVQMAEACCQINTMTGAKLIAPELVGFLQFVLRKDQPLLFLVPSHAFVHWSLPSLPFESDDHLKWLCREEIQPQQCMAMVAGSLWNLVRWIVREGLSRCRRLAAVKKPGSAYKTQPVPSASATVVPVI